MAAEVWRQQRFAEALDEWIEAEEPDEELRDLVGDWALSRLDDPYAGMRREPDFANLWFGVIPGTRRPGGTVIAGSLWIHERDRTVRCDRIGTLSWPA